MFDVGCILEGFAGKSFVVVDGFVAGETSADGNVEAVSVDTDGAVVSV